MGLSLAEPGSAGQQQQKGCDGFEAAGGGCVCAHTYNGVGMEGMYHCMGWHALMDGVGVFGGGRKKFSLRVI